VDASSEAERTLHTKKQQYLHGAFSSVRSSRVKRLDLDKRVLEILQRARRETPVTAAFRPPRITRNCLLLLIGLGEEKKEGDGIVLF